MKTKSSYKDKSPKSPDKNVLHKIKAGIVFILISCYFLFIDTIGLKTFMDHLNLGYKTPAYGDFSFPFYNSDGKMTPCVFFLLIGIFFFGWEIFDLKAKNK